MTNEIIETKTFADADAELAKIQLNNDLNIFGDFDVVGVKAEDDSLDKNFPLRFNFSKDGKYIVAIGNHNEVKYNVEDVKIIPQGMIGDKYVSYGTKYTYCDVNAPKAQECTTMTLIMMVKDEILFGSMNLFGAKARFARLILKKRDLIIDKINGSDKSPEEKVMFISKVHHYFAFTPVFKLTQSQTSEYSYQRVADVTMERLTLEQVQANIDAFKESGFKFSAIMKSATDYLAKVPNH